jgi:hypothetical protein
MRAAMVAYALFLVAPVLSGAQSSKKEPTLTATMASDKADYSLTEDIRLDVRVTNAGRSELTLFAQLLWGHAGGLVLHVYDASNKEVPAKVLDDEMVVPTTLADPHSFITLSRNHYLGTTRVEHVAELVKRPGKYFVQAEYLSPVPGEFGQGPNFWSREKPAVWSNRIEFQVTGQ